jgi:7 transmembrane sweet-taste receptor of 3 GCPR
VFTRYPVKYDNYGNVVQSNGACMSIQITSPTQYAFFGATMAISVFTLLVSAYQSYRARNLPSQFNESKYIAISNLILVESLIIGCPVLVIAREDPATFSLALNALVAVMSLAVLLPVFVPKFTSANDLRNRRYVPTASNASDASAGQVVSSIVHALSRRIGGRRASSGSGERIGRFTSSNVSQVSNASRPLTLSDDGLLPETINKEQERESEPENVLESEATNKEQVRAVEPEPTSK